METRRDTKDGDVTLPTATASRGSSHSGTLHRRSQSSGAPAGSSNLNHSRTSMKLQTFRSRNTSLKGTLVILTAIAGTVMFLLVLIISAVALGRALDWSDGFEESSEECLLPTSRGQQLALEQELLAKANQTASALGTVLNTRLRMSTGATISLRQMWITSVERAITAAVGGSSTTPSISSIYNQLFSPTGSTFPAISFSSLLNSTAIAITSMAVRSVTALTGTYNGAILIARDDTQSPVYCSALLDPRQCLWLIFYNGISFQVQNAKTGSSVPFSTLSSTLQGQIMEHVGTLPTIIPSSSAVQQRFVAKSLFPSNISQTLVPLSPLDNPDLLWGALEDVPFPAWGTATVQFGFTTNSPVVAADLLEISSTTAASTKSAAISYLQRVKRSLVPDNMIPVVDDTIVLLVNTSGFRIVFPQTSPSHPAVAAALLRLGGGANYKTMTLFNYTATDLSQVVGAFALRAAFIPYDARSTNLAWLIVVPQFSKLYRSRSQALSEIRTSLDTVRSKAIASSVSIWLVALLVVVGTVIAMNLFGSAVSESLNELSENLLHVGTLELEKATFFQGEESSAPHRSSPVPGNAASLHGSHSGGSPKESAGSFSRPGSPGKKSPPPAPGSQRKHSPPPESHAGQRPFSRIREIADAQASSNKMIVGLKEFRKYLPPTLFVNSDLPPLDELADEIAHILPDDDLNEEMDLVSPTSPQKDTVETPSDSDKETPFGASRSISIQIPGEGLASPMDHRGAGSNGLPSPASSPSPKHREAPAVVDLDEGDLDSALAFGLRRRKISVLAISFAGFLKLSQESIVEAHGVSQIFLQIVLQVVERRGGVVLHLTADRVIATWNAFKSDAHHQAKAAQCAADLNKTLQAADDEYLIQDVQWVIAVSSGIVLCGNSGTKTERASVAQGPCIEFVTEVLSLLLALGIRVAVTQSIKDHLPSRMWTIPVDCITESDDQVTYIYELHMGEEPPYVADIRIGFSLMCSSSFSDAAEAFTRVLRQSSDPHALRLLKVSLFFQELKTPYVRMLPSWQTFESDMPPLNHTDSTKDISAFNGRVRYRSEKRKSYLADEHLRMELQRLQTQGKPPLPASTHLGVNHDESLPPGGGVSPRNASSNQLTHLRTTDAPPTATTPKPGARKRFPSILVPSMGPFSPDKSATSFGADSLTAQPTVGALGSKPHSFVKTDSGSISPKGEGKTSPTSPKNMSNAIGGSPPALRLSPPPQGAVPVPVPLPPPTNVIEFRDRKNMLFRMSDHVLGKGAFGQVLLGMTESGGLVAIKEVPIPQQVAEKELSAIEKRRLKRKGIPVVQNSTEETLEEVLNEVAVLSKLRHENIVGYLSSALIEGGKKLVVVMEYISGGSLHTVLRDFKNVPIANVRRYCRDTLRGLQFLHDADIVHRDIKPHNVLVLIEGSCKLTDFGTSANMSKLAGVTSGLQGTPQYMAPEAARNRDVTKASDIWSFGVMLAQLINGELPWEDGPGGFVPVRFLYQLANDESMVPVLPASMAEDAASVVRMCCQREASKRPTAAELLAHPFFQLQVAPPVARKSRTNSTRNRNNKGVLGSPFSPNKSPFRLSQGSTPGGQDSDQEDILDKVIADSHAGRQLFAEESKAGKSNGAAQESAFATASNVTSPTQEREPSTFLHNSNSDSNSLGTSAPPSADFTAPATSFEAVNRGSVSLTGSANGQLPNLPPTPHPEISIDDTSFEMPLPHLVVSTHINDEDEISHEQAPDHDHF